MATVAMELYSPQANPHTRKLLAAAAEAGCSVHYCPCEADGLPERIRQSNPALRLPLLLHEGQCICGDTVICEFFHSRGGRLFPEDPQAAWQALRWLNWADCLLDLLWAGRSQCGERERGPQLLRIFDFVEPLSPPGWSLGTLAMASALWELSLEGWLGETHPRLRAWLDQVSTRPSLQEAERTLQGHVLSADDEIDRFLREQAKEGLFDSSGHFSLPPIDAARKLLQEQRGQPALFLLKTLQGLIGLGCEEIHLEDSEFHLHVTAGWGRRSLPGGSLGAAGASGGWSRDLVTGWQALGAYGDSNPVAHLMMGVILAFAIRPDVQLDELLDQSRVRRWTFDALDGPARLQDSGAGTGDGLRLRLPIPGRSELGRVFAEVRRRYLFGPPLTVCGRVLQEPWRTCPARADWATAESYHLLELVEYADSGLPVPPRGQALVLNGIRCAGSGHTDTLLRLTEGKGPRAVMVAWVTTDLGAGSYIHFAHHGLLLNPVQFESPIAGASAFVHFDKFSVDLSGLNVVDNLARQRCLEEVQSKLARARPRLLESVDAYVPSVIPDSLEDRLWRWLIPGRQERIPRLDDPRSARIRQLIRAEIMNRPT